MPKRKKQLIRLLHTNPRDCLSKMKKQFSPDDRRMRYAEEGKTAYSLTAYKSEGLPQ